MIIMGLYLFYLIDEEIFNFIQYHKLWNILKKLFNNKKLLFQI